jgi:protein phosphatase
MRIAIPEHSLVVLIGPSGSGKSHFAASHFGPTEVISSDRCRALVADDENDQEASGDAFELLRFIAGKRLAQRRIAVIDATNVRAEDRKPLVALAREHHVLPVAIVLSIPDAICNERNRARADRDVGARVVRGQRLALRREQRGLSREGFRYVYTLRSPEEVSAAVVERTRLWTDRRDDAGPFDVIGDVHGCGDEIEKLLEQLGYTVARMPTQDPRGRYEVHHPEGRKLVFLGDLIDRGPRITDVLALVMDAVESGVALCVPGNHETKLLRKLQGQDVRIGHGLAQTLEQLEAETEAFRARVERFIDGLVSHYELDGGKLVVAHAGLRENMHGRASAAVRAFALYGETTGETDEFGLPVRYDWASEYRGSAMVVYGHTPVPEIDWLNRTVCIDTGCVFGGKLTALRYPEREIVQVSAARVYFEPTKPLAANAPSARTAQQAHDDLLDMADVSGKRVVSTRLKGSVPIRAENAAAALEVMSRFAADPRWLIYLPPTMAPTKTSTEAEWLERPEQVFDDFERSGVHEVVCQEKHMGSRAVVVVCRDERSALARFGVEGQGLGIVYTRTGRRFFPEGDSLETELLERVRRAAEVRDLWAHLGTDWLCLDCELMPWSAKARALLVEQYAPTGCAGRAALASETDALQNAARRGIDVGTLLERQRARLAMIEAYTVAYRRYCWDVRSVADLRLAPFHLLASEGAVHAERDHGWHMGMLAELCAGDTELLLATSFLRVDLADIEAKRQATRWWEELTERGGEGMVVKPLTFVSRGPRGLVQPALKCRGREYLRIIYGPEYTAPEHLSRLRRRSTSRKRSLALSEFALGIEALERFVRREPLRGVHECVFGVLALESEPVDPRL